jgi:polyisoprenoid-binding protein YceI
VDARESWRIDADRSTLAFHVPHARLEDVSGRFDCWGGRILVDPADPQRTVVGIWVELSSVDTGSRRRDEELLRTELFDQPWEPALNFDSDRLELCPSGATLSGWVSLRAKRTWASIAVDAPQVTIDASGRPRFRCTARASLERKALGLGRSRTEDWLSDRLLGNQIEILAHVEASRESASPIPFLPDALRSGLLLRAGAAPT